ncbi:MAG: hypothetical protein PHE83_09450 [Opitutaceae bacterium]|nr:hypothetical protein [Opitutaceae bacterium]
MKVWLALAALVFLPGCTSLRGRAARMVVHTPTTTVTQSGDVKSPGTVQTVTSTAEIPIPAGSTVTWSPPAPPAGQDSTPAAPGAVAVVVSAPTALRASTVTETVKGPESPAPPSPAEIAKGEGVRWFYIAGAVAGLAALAAFYFGHPVNGTILLAGAVGLPLVGNFVGSAWAQRVAIAIFALAAGIGLAWLILRKYHPEYIAAIKAKLPVPSA